MDASLSKFTHIFAITILVASTLNILYKGVKALKNNCLDEKKELKISLIYIFANITLIIWFFGLD